MSLAITEWGAETGRPVVLLHGFLEQGPAWDAVASALPGRIVAPDHRGHGHSDHVPPGAYYPFWDYVSDLDALVQTLGGEIDLVGHSMGGTIASLFAATRPQCVRRLVLIEGLGPPDFLHVGVERARKALDQRRAWPKHPCFADVEAAAARMQRFNPSLDDAIAQALASRLVRPVVADDPEVRDPVEGALTWRWDRRHRMAYPRPFHAGSHMTFLRAITAPTLLIDGQTGFRLPDGAERRACIADHRHLEIAGAGHLVHHDAPSILADAITEHLGG